MYTTNLAWNHLRNVVKGSTNAIPVYRVDRCGTAYIDEYQSYGLHNIKVYGSLKYS